MTNGANIQYHDISKHDEEMKEPLDPESDLESIISPDATQTLPVDVSTPRQSRPQNEVTTAASQVELRTRSETKSVPKPTGSTARARNQELEALSLGSDVFTQLPVGSKTQDSNLAFPPNSQPERLNQYSRPAEQVKFVQEIETFQQQLDEEYRTFQASLVDGNRDATVSLVDCEQLEEQYSKEINSKLNEEKVITDDLSTRFQVCHSSLHFNQF